MKKRSYKYDINRNFIQIMCVYIMRNIKPLEKVVIRVSLFQSSVFIV